tara:strand:+ start:1292 stop:1591 length:300 start_codon:yes stop_codon:yes gene_type:complete
MKKSELKNIIKEELKKVLAEQPTRAVKRGTVTDNTRLAMVLSSLGKRARGAFQKRKVVSQVILKLAAALEITPNEVLRAYMDYKKDAKGNASTKVKKDD